MTPYTPQASPILDIAGKPAGGGAMRKPRDVTFRKADVVRALKAAQAAGIVNPTVKIAPDGTISIIPAPEPEPRNESNEVENWISRHDHQG